MRRRLRLRGRREEGGVRRAGRRAAVLRFSAGLRLAAGLRFGAAFGFALRGFVAGFAGLRAVALRRRGLRRDSLVLAMPPS